MEMQKEEAKMLQWHPAFFAEIQIELQEDAEHLILRMSISWEPNQKKSMF